MCLCGGGICLSVLVLFCCCCLCPHGSVSDSACFYLCGVLVVSSSFCYVLVLLLVARGLLLAGAGLRAAHVLSGQCSPSGTLLYFRGMSLSASFFLYFLCYSLSLILMTVRSKQDASTRHMKRERKIEQRGGVYIYEF